MPDLIDIAERATDRPPVALLHEPRCLVARDAAARCTACADACPVGAVAVRRPVIEGERPYESVSPSGEAGPRIDDEQCVRCGACVVACPTNALLPLPPLDDEALLERVAVAGVAAVAAPTTDAPSTPPGAPNEPAGIGAASALPSIAAPTTSGSPAPSGASDEVRETTASTPAPATAGLACERVAQALRLDGERVVVLPCLAWVDAALLVHLACSGAERIAVPLDACASCDLGPIANRVRTEIANARCICAAAHLEASIDTADGAGLSTLGAAPDADAAGEFSRRNLLAQAGSSLLDTARSQAARQLDSLAGAPAADVRPEPDVRRWQLLDDLHAAGLAGCDAVVPRTLAPRVRIDAEHCSGCAQCALFCPTGALRKAGRLPGGRTLLEFDPARCRDCGVCEDTCRYGALACDETLTAAELFALDPAEITLPKRRVLPERRGRA